MRTHTHTWNSEAPGTYGNYGLFTLGEEWERIEDLSVGVNFFYLFLKSGSSWVLNLMTILLLPSTCQDYRSAHQVYTDLFWCIQCWGWNPGPGALEHAKQALTY